MSFASNIAAAFESLSQKLSDLSQSVSISEFLTRLETRRFRTTEINAEGTYFTATTEGWYTFAIVIGKDKVPSTIPHAWARFLINEESSNSFSTFELIASHHNTTNHFKVNGHNQQSASNIRAVRTRYGAADKGAVLQLYLAANTKINVAMRDNITRSGWVLMSNLQLDTNDNATFIGNLGVNIVNMTLVSSLTFNSTFYTETTQAVNTAEINVRNQAIKFNTEVGALGSSVRYDPLSLTYNFIANSPPTSVGNAKLKAGSISLGAGNTNLAFKVISGTLPPDRRTTFNYAHGLNYLNIVHIWGMALSNDNFQVMDQYEIYNSENARWFLTINSSVISISFDYNSRRLWGRPFKMVIWYEV